MILVLFMQIEIVEDEFISFVGLKCLKKLKNFQNKHLKHKDCFFLGCYSVTFI